MYSFCYLIVLSFWSATGLFLFDSGQMLTGLSITPAPMRVEWTPSLHQAAASGGESRPVEVRPSPLGVVPSQPVASTTAMEVMVVISVAAEAASEVTLMAPPPPAVVEEEREIELPASPGGGLHGSPSQSKLEVSGGRCSWAELEHLPMAHKTEVVEIPSDDEADDEVEPSVLSRELAVVWSEDGPSSGLEETDLEWPCPEDPTKVRFILRDSQECQL